MQREGRPLDKARLLVVGADELRHRALHTFARLGASVTLVDGSSPSRYEHMVDEYIGAEVRDDKGPDVTALRALAKAHDGVLTLSDRSAMVAAAVADSLGMPGPGTRAATTSRSKLLQRQLGAGSTFSIPRWSAVRDEADIRRFFDTPRRSAVLKPADSAGSTAVYPVASVAEAVAKWPDVVTFSPSRTAIIEERIAGPEVSVEAIVQAGEPVWIGVTEKRTGGPTGFLETGHVVSSRVATPELEVARASLVELASLWGVRTAVMHAEFKRTQRGLALIEAAVRPGGDLIPDLVQIALGCDIYASLALMSVGENAVVRSPPLAAYASVRFLFGSGTVRRFVPPVEILDSYTTVKIVNQVVQSGRRLQPMIGNWTRAGYALGYHANRDLLESELAGAIQRLADALGISPSESLG